MKKITLTICALVLCASAAFAGSKNEGEKLEFNPHWYIQVQGGAAYTLGEVAFDKLISPAAAISAGRQFTPVFGLRFGVSGWQSKGAWVNPETIYKYNFAQANVDATFDLCNLFGRFNAKRTVNPYVFAGLGVNYAFNNDDAEAIGKDNLTNLWTGSKVFVAGRAGLGINFRLSDCILLGLEANANAYSDKYNSKDASSIDWQFNALAGLTFRLAKNYKAVAAAPVAAVAAAVAATVVEEKPAPAPAPVKKAEPAPVVAPAPITENVFFSIGSSEIQGAEATKVASLIDYLKANPKAKVDVTGYADKGTGTATVNDKISLKRAQSVAAELEKAGIAADRINVDSKGSSVQPFEINNENRVVICITE